MVYLIYYLSKKVAGELQDNIFIQEIFPLYSCYKKYLLWEKQEQFTF